MAKAATNISIGVLFEWRVNTAPEDGTYLLKPTVHFAETGDRIYFV
jgi:hypothetical protein